MNFQTDKILLNQDVERKKDVFVVEDSIIIPDVKPDIISIIETSSNLYVYKKELNNGKLKIDGGVLLDTIYTADDEKNSTRAIHNTLDFSKTIDVQIDSKESNTFSSNLCVTGIDSKIVNGRKISVKLTIEYEIVIYSNREIEFINTVDDDSSIQKIEKTMDISMLKQRGETICSAKDTMTIENNLADILCCNISVRNREQKVSYNKILSKADCVVDLLYMNEDNEIRSSSTVIPIMGFIDMPGVSDEELSTINYETRNINIKPDSVNSNNVLVEIEFLVNCDLYEKRSISVIQDLYSPEEEVTLYQEEVNLSQNRNIMKESCEVNEKLNLSDAKDNKIYITDVSKNNINQRVLGDSINYEGSINVNFLFESNITKRLEQRSQSIEFSHNIKLDGINNNAEVNTDFEFNNIEARASQNGGEQELNIGINFTINTYTRSMTNLINNVKVEKIEQDKRESSLIIYFIKEGDSLWKIAKKFRTTIEEIVEVNGIEDTDKLNTGEQLFIPRHVCQNAC